MASAWLDEQARALGGTLNKHIKERDAAVKALIEGLQEKLKAQLRKLLKQLSSQDVEDVQSAANQLASMAGIYESLVELGLREPLDKITRLYGKELASVRQELKKVDPKLVLTDFDVDAARALVDFDIGNIENKIRERVGGLRSVIARAVVSGSTPDYVALADEWGGRIAAQIETELNTGLSAFNQSITNMKADEVEFTTFIYLGPDDDITRPFCEDLINAGRIFDKSEIEQMDNGQGLPVMECKGGWNCRHQWAPISDEKAERLRRGE